jgi:hypothetical protein
MTPQQALEALAAIASERVIDLKRNGMEFSSQAARHSSKIAIDILQSMLSPKEPPKEKE